MKRLLAIALAFVMIMGTPVSAFAAETKELGSSDFPTRVSGRSTVVTRTVRTKKETVKVTGLYYASQGKEVFKLLNEERAAAGLKKLTWEDGLVQPAIQRALEQYVFYGQNPPLSHTRPNGSSEYTVSSLLNGENLAGGDTEAYDVMVGWMNSPSHRDNILEEAFTSVACVCVETDQMVYWVQLFHADGRKNTAAQDTDDGEDSGGVTAKSIAASLDKAKTAAAKTSVTLKDSGTLAAAAIKAASDWGVKNKKTVSITATTPVPGGKSTQGRMTFNPSAFVNNKNGLKTGVRVDEDSVSGVRKSFNKWYPKNTVSVIKLDQTGSLGGSVTVGAKSDLSGLDSKKLIFYIYDKSSNKISKLDLGKAGYTIDKNKYLNFITNRGGYVIVTDKVLSK